jgi:hypothetical protein
LPQNHLFLAKRVGAFGSVEDAAAVDPGPEIVDTVTSGDVVTMRSASASSYAPISPRVRPNASWFESRSPRGIGSAGTRIINALRGISRVA